jgi:peptidoglycan/LPS O-acetylase OafA/YrhL
LALPLLATSIVMRALTWYPHLLLTRCDGLILGALLASLVGDEAWRAARARRLCQTFATLLVVGMIASASCHRGWPLVAGVMPGFPWHMIGYSLSIFAQCVAYTGLVGLVLTAAGAPWLAPLRDPRLVYLGTISYGIYLWHPIVAGMIVAWHTQVLRIHNGLIFTVLEIVASVAVAALSWHAFEKPILRWKDRFGYARPDETILPAPHFDLAPPRNACDEPAAVAEPGSAG